MKLIAFYVIKKVDYHPVFIVNTMELSFISFLKRPFVKQSLNFGARTFAKKI